MFYVVKEGRNTGIYDNYDEMYKNIIGFPCALFKTFESKDEADLYLEEEITTKTPTDYIAAPSGIPYAFVDGSFNDETKTYGYGGLLIVDNMQHILQGSDNGEELGKMRNVAGELAGCKAAIEKAKELNLEKILILYDYMGIGMWAMGKWKRNIDATKEYYEFVKETAMNMQVFFKKVKAHSMIEGNEIADKLAKEAVGIE